MSSASPSSSTLSSARPATVTAAFWLWIVEAVISIVFGLIVVTVAANTPAVTSLSGEDRDRAAAVLVGVGVVFVVFAVARGLIAFAMRRGHNWARIVLTVLAVLSIVATILQGGASGWLVWVANVIAVLAVVLMFVPASNPWFRRRSAAGAPAVATAP